MARSQAIRREQISALADKLRNQYLPQTTARVAQQLLDEQERLSPRPYKQFVDGREGASFSSVIPGGNIRIEFSAISNILAWIHARLKELSPVLTGAYKADHELYIDGEQIADPEAENIPIPPGAEAMLINLRPYARRIEHGWSKQAPNGVYEIVSVAAMRQFSYANITFEYVAFGGSGQVLRRAGSRYGHVARRGSFVRTGSYTYPAIIIKEQ